MRLRIKEGWRLRIGERLWLGRERALLKLRISKIRSFVRLIKPMIISALNYICTAEIIGVISLNWVISNIQLDCIFLSNLFDYY